MEEGWAQSYDRLDEIDGLTREHGLVLIPHITSPLPRDGKRPSEADILISGTYNLGFLGVSFTERTLALLAVGYIQPRLAVVVAASLILLGGMLLVACTIWLYVVPVYARAAIICLVASLPWRENDPVAAGAVLLALDSAEFAFNLASANTRLVVRGPVLESLGIAAVDGEATPPAFEVEARLRGRVRAAATRAVSRMVPSRMASMAWLNRPTTACTTRSASM